ncbi:MAG: DUF551 domain-containing protein [Bacteroides sp.]|nr:DUF551 domain-containing protein [Bacteroides sp.]
MKTLEDKARITREKVIYDLKRAYEKHKDIQHYATASACIEMYGMGLYMSGAKEALSSQWRKPEDELPEDGQMVLIREYHRSAKNGRFVNHIREFMFFEQYGFKLEERKNAHLDYRVTHWMPIPGLPDDK